jgi:hypothetical protein
MFLVNQVPPRGIWGLLMKYQYEMFRWRFAAMDLVPLTRST